MVPQSVAVGESMGSDASVRLPPALKITNGDLHTCFQERTGHSKANVTGTTRYKRHFTIDFFHLLDPAKIVDSDDKESRLQGQTNAHYVNF